MILGVQCARKGFVPTNTRIQRYQNIIQLCEIWQLGYFSSYIPALLLRSKLADIWSNIKTQVKQWSNWYEDNVMIRIYLFCCCIPLDDCWWWLVLVAAMEPNCPEIRTSPLIFAGFCGPGLGLGVILTQTSSSCQYLKQYIDINVPKVLKSTYLCHSFNKRYKSKTLIPYSLVYTFNLSISYESNWLI